MKNIIALALALIICLVTLGFASDKTDDSLTLLNQQQKSSQTTHQSPIANQSTSLYDIQGPVPFQTAPPYLFIAAIILVLILVLLAIFWFLKKRKKPAPPAIPPWEKALAELVEARKLFNARQGLSYMERVSHILRSYIESRFAIRSTRQTTREFLKEMNKNADNTFLQESRGELQACFEQADMAKFAHRIPGQEHMEQMETAVTAFIRKTEPASSQTGGKL